MVLDNVYRRRRHGTFAKDRSETRVEQGTSASKRDIFRHLMEEKVRSTR